MLGITRRRMLYKALACGVVAVAVYTAAVFLFHRPWFSDLMIGTFVGAALPQFLVRPLSRTRLRVTDDTIETPDGPVIRRGAIADVTEYGPDRPVKGIEIVANVEPKWLRKHTIFVPAALREYEQVKQQIRDWVPDSGWHVA